jgi:glutaconate CoA-transferase subunit B
MGFDDDTKEMTLLSVHPGVTVEQVQENTCFELHVDGEVAVTEPPSPEELRLLREEIDPAGIVIGR